MGASKRVAELIVQDFAEKRGRKTKAKVFCAVRFGNVIGSSGSVIPLFKEQIRKGGPITLTHSEATRYFMSIEEAAQLVIQAGTLARRNDARVNSRAASSCSTWDRRSVSAISPSRWSSCPT
jgi:FlaA1/EpsC-like NDP-sugar epimerase